MKRRGDTKIPEFQSLEEEREYWEARGPLVEGHIGRVNKPKPGQKRSSFLAVRLTGEELTRLRDIAAKLGIGPSTFARLVLTSTMEHQSKLPRLITLDELKDMLESNLPQSVKERAETLAKATAIGDPDRPTLLVIDDSQMKKSEELMWSFFSAILGWAGVQVVIPSDAKYKELKSIAAVKEKVK